MTDLVSLFEDIKIVKKVTEEEKPKEVIQTIGLIDDDKRANQFNLAVSKLVNMMKLSYDEIRDMIIQLEDGTLGYDAFVNLASIAPTKDEITKVNSYKKTDKELQEVAHTFDLPTRWVYETRGINFFAQRIEMYAFSKEFNSEFRCKLIMI